MIKLKCPSCNELLESHWVNYWTDATFNGTYNPITEEWEDGDYECNGGDYFYSCPECGDEIDADDMEQIECNNDGEPIETDEEGITIPEKPVVAHHSDDLYANESSYTIKYVQCPDPKCKTKITIEDEEIDTEINCTKCKKEIIITKDIIINSKEGGL